MNPVNLLEAIAIVEDYIKLKKGVVVKINPNQFNDPVNAALLEIAYKAAINNSEHDQKTE